MVTILLLVLLGITVGAYGTLIGAGGGFVLVPVLLLLYPQLAPTTITSISLAVVCANAASGSAAYARMKRIDYQTGRLFALATIPGAVGGVFATGLFSRGPFDMLLGALLVLLALWLVVQPRMEATAEPAHGQSGRTAPGRVTRTLVDARGTAYTYTYNRWLGLGLSAIVGFLSSLLGIGGGIIHVPAMVQLLDIPPHVATATSHFVLAMTSGAGAAVHLVRGNYHAVALRTIALAAGVVPGAQLGAVLSARIQGAWIIRLLALALALVGLRLLLGSA
jgi:uncharacterized membrane protein YfcA